jgi:holin-like protein
MICRGEKLFKMVPSMSGSRNRAGAIKIAVGIGILSLVSWIANWATDFFALPVPGAIMGLLLLALFCGIRGRSFAALDRSSQFLTLLLPLLIMPSSIGIMDHWHLIKEEWLAITVAIVASVLLTLITTPKLIAKIEGKRNVSELS